MWLHVLESIQRILNGILTAGLGELRPEWLRGNLTGVWGPFSILLLKLRKLYRMYGMEDNPITTEKSRQNNPLRQSKLRGLLCRVPPWSIWSIHICLSRVCVSLCSLVRKEVQTRTFAATQVVLLTPRETKVSINKEWLNKLYHVAMVGYYVALQKEWGRTPWTDRARCLQTGYVRKASHRKTDLLWPLWGKNTPPMCLCVCLRVRVCNCVCLCARLCVCP